MTWYVISRLKVYPKYTFVLRSVQELWRLWVFNNTPPKDISALGPSLRTSEWTRCYVIPLYCVFNPTKPILKGSFRLCDWLSFRYLGPWYNHLPLYVGPSIGQFILNKLVCCPVKYILIVPVDIHCHLCVSVAFIFIFNSEKKCWVLCTSICRGRDPCSFWP